MRFQATFGAIFAGIAVVFGAFGAHALKDAVSAESLAVFKTGTEYQMTHGLALLLLAALHDRLACNHRATVTGWLFAAGVLFFSGSLYALALTGIAIFGAITPLGGLCFIAGWIVFAMNAYFTVPNRTDPSDQTDLSA